MVLMESTLRPVAPRRRGLSPDAPFPEFVDAHLRALGTRKPSPHTLDAYRRDLHGVGARMAEAEGVELDELALEHLTKTALREAFSSWATDHAAASLARAWSSWSTFFDFLVAEDPDLRVTGRNCCPDQEVSGSKALHKDRKYGRVKSCRSALGTTRGQPSSRACRLPMSCGGTGWRVATWQ
ncbi:MAG: site-specific integrase [Acidimicrobiales bacterium]